MSPVKVPKTPEPTKIPTISDREPATITKIRTFDNDVKSFKSRIKTIQESMQELLDGTPEYDMVVKVQEELEIAKANLKRRLESNSQWVKLTDDLGEEKLSLKDATESLSDFLLGYFHETGEKQIELGPQDAREVVLKGKLGKPKDYQTNLFSAPARED